MATEEIADAEVVEGTSTDLVEQTGPPPALFKTDDPVEVIEQATRVADALKAVIDKQGLVQRIQNKDYVRVEGWTTLGAMLGVSAVCTDTEVVDGGYKATVEARMPDGRVVGRADAMCTKHEKQGPWKGAPDYARLSMAQTRATSKALRIPLGFVVALAGFETTPADEISTQGPAVGPPQEQDKANLLLNADQLNRMLRKIDDSGNKRELVFAAVGLDGPDGVTVDHANRIAELIA